jgi:hypothetical protein
MFQVARRRSVRGYRGQAPGLTSRKRQLRLADQKFTTDKCSFQAAQHRVGSTEPGKKSSANSWRRRRDTQVTPSVRINVC